MLNKIGPKIAFFFSVSESLVSRFSFFSKILMSFTRVSFESFPYFFIIASTRIFRYFYIMEKKLRNSLEEINVKNGSRPFYHIITITF